MAWWTCPKIENGIYDSLKEDSLLDMRIVIRAIGNGHMDIFDQMNARKVSIDYRYHLNYNVYGETNIRKTIVTRDVDSIVSYLDLPPTIKLVYFAGFVLLAWNGNATVARAFVQKIPVSIQYYALLGACMYGHTDIVDMILGPKIEPYLADHSYLAFRLACTHCMQNENHIKMAQQLCIPDTSSKNSDEDNFENELIDIYLWAYSIEQYDIANMCISATPFYIEVDCDKAYPIFSKLCLSDDWLHAINLLEHSHIDIFANDSHLFKQLCLNGQLSMAERLYTLLTTRHITIDENGDPDTITNQVFYLARGIVRLYDDDLIQSIRAANHHNVADWLITLPSTYNQEE